MMSDLRKIWLVARREYLAYVGAWGFWISLMTTPLLILALIFAPVFLRRTEPVRVMTIVAERPLQAQAIRAAFDKPQGEEQRDAMWKQAFEAAPK